MLSKVKSNSTQQEKIILTSTLTLHRDIIVLTHSSPLHNSPHCTRAASFSRRHDYAQLKSSLQGRPARRRDLYLKTHNTRNRPTSMPSAGFEPAIPGNERQQNHALDRAATGISLTLTCINFNIIHYTVLNKCTTNCNYRVCFNLLEIDIFCYERTTKDNFYFASAFNKLINDLQDMICRSVCQTATVILKEYTAFILMEGTKAEAVVSLQTSVPIYQAARHHIQKVVILIQRESQVSQVLRTFKRQIKINEYWVISGFSRDVLRALQSCRMLGSAEWQLC